MSMNIIETLSSDLEVAEDKITFLNQALENLLDATHDILLQLDFDPETYRAWEQEGKLISRLETARIQAIRTLAHTL